MTMHMNDSSCFQQSTSDAFAEKNMVSIIQQHILESAKNIL